MEFAQMLLYPEEFTKQIREDGILFFSEEKNSIKIFYFFADKHFFWLSGTKNLKKELIKALPKDLPRAFICIKNGIFCEKESYGIDFVVTKKKCFESLPNKEFANTIENLINVMEKQ